MMDNRLHLVHIKECIKRVEDYTAGGREQFASSHLMRRIIQTDLPRLKNIVNETMEMA
jgi:uncharacterized protein with HEPN domain